MLNGTTERLEEAIIEAFSRTPYMTAGNLAAAVAKRGRPFTIQAVYQELRKLQRERIVTKVRDRYMLRIAWVLEMVELTDRLYSAYSRHGSLLDLLPAEGERVSWKISSVSRLVTFWAQINLALLTVSGERKLFEFLPHIWFHLAAGSDETQFLKSLRLTGVTYYCAVQGDSYLDRAYLKTATAVNAEIRFGLSPFRQPMETYHGVIGDFLVTCKLSQKVRLEIERLYKAVLGPADYPSGTFAELFNCKEPATFLVERGTPRAKKYRKQFAEFFGVPNKLKVPRS